MLRVNSHVADIPVINCLHTGLEKQHIGPYRIDDFWVSLYLSLGALSVFWKKKKLAYVLGNYRIVRLAYKITIRVSDTEIIYVPDFSGILTVNSPTFILESESTPDLHSCHTTFIELSY